MTNLLTRRHQGSALRYLLLEMATRQTIASLPGGYQTITGEMVSRVAGQAALQAGTAVLVGGLLVGIIPADTEEI